MTDNEIHSTGNETCDSPREWKNAHEEWGRFVDAHPELGYRRGMWQLHNFLRLHRDALARRDAIRKARGRHWIAHSGRFAQAAFDCATGHGAQCNAAPVAVA